MTAKQVSQKLATTIEMHRDLLAQMSHPNSPDGSLLTLAELRLAATHRGSSTYRRSILHCVESMLRSHFAN